MEAILNFALCLMIGVWLVGVVGLSVFYRRLPNPGPLLPANDRHVYIPTMSSSSCTPLGR